MKTPLTKTRHPMTLRLFMWVVACTFAGSLNTLDAQIPFYQKPVSIAGGNKHSLFITCNNTSAPTASGLNTAGQLGNGNNLPSNTPVGVENPAEIFSFIRMIAAGGNHSLFINGDSSFWAMGNNSFGQLGIGTNTNSNTPNPVSMVDMKYGIAIAAGGNHSLFVSYDNNLLINNTTVWASGLNTSGQLGDGTIIQSITPVQVKKNATDFLTDIVAVAAGDNHSLFLKNDGMVWASGLNTDGQLGIGTNTNINFAVQVKKNATDFLTDIVAIEAGGDHSLFLKNDGTVWASGRNTDGQLGIGTNTNSNFTVQVKKNATDFLTNIVEIAAGGDHSLFLTAIGAAYATGRNIEGQLGVGTNANINTPTRDNPPLTWTGLISSNYNDPKNWTPTSVPCGDASITISNVTNLPQPNSDITISNITLSGGVFNLGSYNLTATTISGGSATSYFNTSGGGSLTLTDLPAGTTTVIPVGTATSYDPVSIIPTSKLDGFTVGIREISSTSPATCPTLPNNWG